jgi:hypothetical protein
VFKGKNFGVGCRGGVEVVAHSLRDVLALHKDSDMALLKIEERLQPDGSQRVCQALRCFLGSSVGRDGVILSHLCLFMITRECSSLPVVFSKEIRSVLFIFAVATVDC